MRGLRTVGMIVAGALAVSALLGAGEAAAKRRKPKLVAKVSGKRFHANVRPSITGTYQSSGVILNGNQRIGLARFKMLTIVCGGISITTATFPTIVDCSATLLDNGVGNPRHPANPKGWGGSGMMVTFTGFDGTVVTGTFTGSLPPGDINPNDPPADFQNGKFAVPLINSGA